MTGRRPLRSDDVTGSDDVTCRPFRVRPEARGIWRQHTGGSVGYLLGQQPAPPAPAGLPSVTAGACEGSVRKCADLGENWHPKWSMFYHLA